jgi:Domain of unknown function (DUF6391)
MPHLLDQPTLLHTRRNHALEHATLHVLSARPRHTVLAGHSDAHGFYLLGEVATVEVEAAVRHALTRLRTGEARLAVHPNCGTNLITGAVLAGSASFLVTGVTRRHRWTDWLDQLPLALLASLAGLMLAQPLGGLLQQRITTEPQLGDLQVAAVQRVRWRGPTLHRILTVS